MKTISFHQSNLSCFENSGGYGGIYERQLEKINDCSRLGFIWLNGPLLCLR
jgi:hypothetical protein